MSSSSQTPVLSRQHISVAQSKFLLWDRDARSLEELKNFPFVDDATIANLAIELPIYLATADGFMCDGEEDKLTGHSSTQDCIDQEVITRPAQLCCCWEGV